MTYLGEVLSLSCAAMWACAVILFRVVGHTISAWNLNLFKNCIAVLLFVPTLFIIYGIDWPQLPASTLAILLLSGFLGITLADTVYLRALNLLGPSRHAVITCLYSPFVITLSVLFLGERFGPAQGFGFLLVIIGVILVNYRKARREIDDRLLRAGVFYGVVAELLMAAGIVITKPIVTGESPIYVAAVRIFGGTAGMLAWNLIHPRSRNSLKTDFAKRPIPWAILLTGSILGTYLSMIVWIAGYKYTSASTASILNQTSVIFILVLAVWFLGEHMNRRQVFGSFLGFLGVAAIILLAPRS